VGVLKSGSGFHLGAGIASSSRELAPDKPKGNEMLDASDSLRSRRILTLFFAFLSAASAVSTAVAPAILHI
jgi:hypothetical protein